MTAAALPLWTAADAAAATGGTAGGSWTATGVSIDSRTVQPGDLFTAIKGPNFDGHDFVRQALQSGAVAALVSRAPAEPANGDSLLTVGDTLRALGELGQAGRKRSEATIIAVTGSVGKTGVKEALAFLLGRQKETHFSAGSYNNRFGVPLSLARLSPSAAYGVFELGMNHAGELTELSNLVRPNVAIITTVEVAHLEFFASLADIARAKSEIFAGLEPDGIAVLNRDNPYFDLMAEAARAADAEIVTFGRHDDARFRVVQSEAAGAGSDIEAMADGKRIAFHLPLPGDHWVANALAVLAVLAAAGGDLKQAADDISGLKPAKRRGERHQVRFAGMCFEIIDDSYNASPAAVAAALSVLGQSAPGPSGRRIAVLGDMLELGGDSPALHQALKDDVEASAIDLVFAVGAQMKFLFDAVAPEKRGGWAETAEELAPVILASVHSGDVVLVKGSAGLRMGQIVDALRNLDSDPVRMAGGR